MKRKAVDILVLICLLTGLGAGWVQGADAAPPVLPASAVSPDESARQLRIYRDSLLQGSSEDIRVDAAVGLLLRDDAASREVLTAALTATDNGGARQAVCKALIKSRGLGQTIGSRSIYLAPLMTILASDEADGAVLAAEALLLFRYKDIETALEAILQTEDGSVRSRLNAVYALQIRSEPQSLARLVGLLDDPDATVAKAAENALQEAFGIPVGASRKVWDEILEMLQQKTPDDIRREMLLLKETRLRQVQAERDRWQKLYLGALDKQYEALDEAGRGAMALEMLTSELAPVRVWALEKVVRYPTMDPKVLRERLLALLGDTSREVRLLTAKVLNSMSALDPAAPLLAQFRQEEDAEVRLAMFEAMGEACFFAFSPGSAIALSPEIKSETLSIAVQYLASEQADAAKRGAEVIRKLMGLNNLTKEQEHRYLLLLAERYERAAAGNRALRADLLAVMARLCGQGTLRGQACPLYEAFFAEALTLADEPALRLAALKGMVNVNPVHAMTLAREYKLMDDDNLAVRQVVIDLAGEVGAAADLTWLLEVMGANGQAEAAWQAAKLICRRQDSEFLLSWTAALDPNGLRGEAVREILEMAEQKAIVEKKYENVQIARRRLIQGFRQRENWDQGAAFLTKIEFSPADEAFDEATAADVLTIYLYAGDVSTAIEVLETRLLKGDLAEASPLLASLEAFGWDERVLPAAKRAVLEQLLAVMVPDRPLWEAFKSQLPAVEPPQPEPEAAPASDIRGETPLSAASESAGT